ncbi:MAG: ABC transporter permease [Acidimicrobiia bacterium]|nr:MAG: ABC transporter permease [Acidimicrobiia bacterium]
MTTSFYDSDQARRPLISEFQNIWDHRGLVRLLVGRDLTLRYKRSVLGVWWTFLNPLLTTAVLWIVFGQFFRFEIPGAPYIVYLLSGILLMTYFSQATLASGSAIVNNAGILSKVYVPAEVFSFAAATAAAANFTISLGVLLIIQVATGVGIPWTVVLTPIPILAMLAFTAGLGLLIASAAVRFFDVIDFSAVLIQLASYLAPTFYPIEIVPDRFLPLIYSNPLYSYLVVFRGFVYEGVIPPTWNLLYMAGSAVIALALGVWVFSRSWKSMVVVL